MIIQFFWVTIKENNLGVNKPINFKNHKLRGNKIKKNGCFKISQGNISKK
jgi:hypothetical protein